MRNKVYKYLSFVVFALLYVHTAIVVLICLPFAYFRLKRIVRFIVHFWAKSVFWFLGKKLKVSGRENYSKKKQYIIIANHASLFDIMAIMSIYPDVAWFGHGRLMKVPVFNQILKMINYIPLKEKSIRNTRFMLDQVIEKSKTHTIAIFPEGTRSHNGSMKNFYRGFVYILRDSDSDVLPVTLNGFFRLKPKNRENIDFSAKLSAVIHSPVKSVDLKDKSDQEIISEMKAIIESKLIVN